MNGFKKNKNGTSKKAARITGVNEPIHENYPLNDNRKNKNTITDEMEISKTYK